MPALLALLAGAALASGKVAPLPFPVAVVPVAPVAAAVLAPIAPAGPSLGLPAPALQIGAPALRALRSRPALPGAGAVFPKQLEGAWAAAGRRFDGSGPRGVAATAVVSARTSFARQGYLRSTLPEDQGWLDSVVVELRRSRTARGLLRRVEALTKERGRPVPVEVADVRPLAGEFNFDIEMVRLKSALKRRDLDDAASVLAHELLHAVQKAEGLPSDLFEMELEAYMLDIRVALELGGEYGGTPWDAKVEKHFRRGVDALMDFLLGGLYKDDASVLRLGLRGLESRLLEQTVATRGRIARIEGRIAKRRETAATLREIGHPEPQVLHYEGEVIAKLERKLSDVRTILAWHERDLALLVDPAGRERVRRYARKVSDYARRTHRWYTSRD